MFRSERRFCYENYKDDPERKKNFHCFGFKGEKQIAFLTLLPQKEKADVENRKGERGIETCIDCNQIYRQCGK